MIEALEAEGPHSSYGDKMMQFGRLIGSWDTVGRHFDEDGNVLRELIGEWHFGWVLEGRVIQDVLISPPRTEREPGEDSFAYDTAIRVYDPRIDGWRVTAFFPIYGASVNLIAREHGEEMWLEGRSPENNLFRWTFSNFSDDRVVWRGYVSKDEGRNWVHEEEITLQRRS
jgi:hypothetical protein